LTVFRLTPDNSAICEAVKSTGKSFTSCRIFASEILERYAWWAEGGKERRAQEFLPRKFLNDMRTCFSLPWLPG